MREFSEARTRQIYAKDVALPKQLMQTVEDRLRSPDAYDEC